MITNRRTLQVARMATINFGIILAEAEGSKGKGLEHSGRMISYAIRGGQCYITYFVRHGKIFFCCLSFYLSLIILSVIGNPLIMLSSEGPPSNYYV